MLDQLIIPILIFFFILITYLVDIVLILKGEILSWSLIRVKGLMMYDNYKINLPQDGIKYQSALIMV